ncbi:MAG: DEAD/DEAH box helicase family protein [Spirochaetales bacterium]|nr:DEAD/DEAH box helicase family protein [Spirochaetales bacterium]
MTNFDFLLEYKEFSDFAHLANEAERQFNKSTMFCGISARKCVEQAVKWMYGADRDLRMPYDDSIQVLVHEETFVKIVPGHIQKDIQAIIKVGNQAVHSNDEVEKARALTALKCLFNFLNWIVYTYSSTYKTRTFCEALIPANKVTIVVKKNQEEIDKYRTELDEKEKSIAELKKQLADLQKSLTDNKSKPKDDSSINYETIDEKTTRKLFIDEDLKKLGWQFDGVMVQEEYPVHNMGDKHSDGFVDYVLFGKDHKPIAVVEAKKTSKDPNIGKQQAKDYADCLEREFGQRPFIFYTNGFDCNFWDDLQATPRSVSMIFSQGDLQKLIDRRSLKKDLDAIQINKEITGRDYQMAAIKSVVKSAKEGHRKFLLVMATGTGKTRTVISLTDIFARANYATNILFLTDRIQLVKQAYSNYKEHLKSMSLCNMLDYKSRQKDKNARIVFSTYPTILNAIDTDKTEDGERLYTPAHFDLIIIDEAHRSIFKKYRAIFDYFDSYLVGLTATPREEVVRSTFDFFGLEHGNPTYNYTYEEAIKAGYLVDYYPVENSTTFIDKGIHFDDLSEDDRRNIEEQYKEEGTSNFEEAPPSDINKFVFNKDTVKKVIEELMENGIKTDAGDKLGKTIIFAYNKKHAQFIVDTFDEMYPHLKGGFCARIVCDDSKVEQTISDFEKPDKNPFIAVSVDMLDTGVDVPEVVNLVFFKKVMSKIKFNQMIGRGTRLCPELSCCDGKNGIYEGKKYFYIFDWLRNFEFFRINKDGVKGSETVSLTESIFNRRVELIKELQAAEYQTPEFEKLRTQLVETVNRQICELNIKLVSHNLKKKYILKFRELTAFNNLEESDVQDLKEHIASLVYMDELDVYAKGFDNLVYGIEVLKCRKNNYSKQQSQIVNDANILLKKKANIEQVKAQIPLLTRITDDSYFSNASVLDLEDMRVKLRELIKFLVESKKKPVRYVDYIDTALTIGEGTPVYSANNFEAYQKKVNSYITEHLDDEAILKLRSNERLTQKDYDKLNDVFTKELGTSEQFEKISDGKPLGVFVRSIAKMDRQKVNELFADFISEFNLNIKQIEFVKVIIENIIEQGEINLERLGDGKPPFDRPGKFFSLFNANAQNRLIQIIRSVNENARVA